MITVIVKKFTRITVLLLFTISLLFSSLLFFLGITIRSQGKNLRLEGHAAHRHRPRSSRAVRKQVPIAPITEQTAIAHEECRSLRYARRAGGYPMGACRYTRGPHDSQAATSEHHAARPYTPLVSVTSIGLACRLLARALLPISLPCNARPIAARVRFALTRNSFRTVTGATIGADRM